MRANIKKIRKKRNFSEDFKKELVNCFEKGEFSVPQLEKLYGISNASIYKWIYKYSELNERGAIVVEMKESSTKKLKELSNKVEELERIVGQKQIKIDFLEKMIEIAEHELEIDIKKKQSTSRSHGLEKTDKS